MGHRSGIRPGLMGVLASGRSAPLVAGRSRAEHVEGRAAVGLVSEGAAPGPLAALAEAAGM
jgi:hypothetical protein